jgi:hypothetical protein
LKDRKTQLAARSRSAIEELKNSKLSWSYELIYIEKTNVATKILSKSEARKLVKKRSRSSGVSTSSSVSSSSGSKLHNIRKQMADKYVQVIYSYLTLHRAKRMRLNGL